MRSNSEHTNLIESSTYRDLRLLSELEANPEVTQRQLSHRMEIALGLTNVLLRNLAQKGYLRVAQATWKRRLYTLTPEGFSHRIRIMVAYVHRVLDHYQQVRQTLREQLETLSLNQESRVAVYGIGEFAELVYLGLKELGIEQMDFFAPKVPAGHKFLGMPVYDAAGLEPERYDRVVIALLAGWEEPFNKLLEQGVSSANLLIFFADGRAREEK